MRSVLREFPCSFEGGLHHLAEGILPLLGAEPLAGEDVVGDAEQAQRTLFRGHGLPVDAGGLHFDGEDAEVLVALIGLRVGVIEHVRGEDLPDAGGYITTLYAIFFLTILTKY